VALAEVDDDELAGRVVVATPDRIFEVERGPAARLGGRAGGRATAIDPWFLDEMSTIYEERETILAAATPDTLSRAGWRRAKRLGFADAQLAHLWGAEEADGAHRPPGGRRRAHLQDGRHLRRRVRGGHAVPLLDVGGRDEVQPSDTPRRC
jgi:hypothetical protein